MRAKKQPVKFIVIGCLDARSTFYTPDESCGRSTGIPEVSIVQHWDTKASLSCNSKSKFISGYFEFNPLPDVKILHWSELKQSADDI